MVRAHSLANEDGVSRPCVRRATRVVGAPLLGDDQRQCLGRNRSVGGSSPPAARAGGRGRRASRGQGLSFDVLGASSIEIAMPTCCSIAASSADDARVVTRNPDAVVLALAAANDGAGGAGQRVGRSSGPSCGARRGPTSSLHCRRVDPAAHSATTNDVQPSAIRRTSRFPKDVFTSNVTSKALP
jgi:hypothetical protein